MGITISKAQRKDLRWFVQQKNRRNAQFHADGDSYKSKNKKRKKYDGSYKNRTEIQKIQQEFSDTDSDVEMNDTEQLQPQATICTICNYNKCRCKEEMDEEDDLECEISESSPPHDSNHNHGVRIIERFRELFGFI